jgi:adenylate cyclase
MMADKSVAKRLGWVLETLTRQSSRLQDEPAYGSWILGRVSESQRRRRVRIQIILTTFVIVANLLGIGVSLLIVTLVFPTPSVFAPDVRLVTFAIAPAYVAAALVVGVVWATNRVINRDGRRAARISATPSSRRAA